jgi:hypothetical protein
MYAFQITGVCRFYVYVFGKNADFIGWIKGKLIKVEISYELFFKKFLIIHFMSPVVSADSMQSLFMHGCVSKQFRRARTRR